MEFHNFFRRMKCFDLSLITFTNIQKMHESLLNSKVSKNIRNQGQTLFCWAFAISTMLRQSLNLSINQIDKTKIRKNDALKKLNEVATLSLETESLNSTSDPSVHHSDNVDIENSITNNINTFFESVYEYLNNDEEEIDDHLLLQYYLMNDNQRDFSNRMLNYIRDVTKGNIGTDSYDEESYDEDSYDEESGDEKSVDENSISTESASTKTVEAKSADTVIFDIDFHRQLRNELIMIPIPKSLSNEFNQNSPLNQGHYLHLALERVRNL